MRQQNILIYLHGFISSPGSFKALKAKEYIQEYSDIEFVCPQLDNYPAKAIEQVLQLIEKYQYGNLGFIGSSLGGFYATYLAERYQSKAVLVNPAVKPYELLQSYLGEHTHPHTNQAFTLQRQHMQQLIEQDVAQLTHPENFWLLAQKDDETLDYRQAESKYQGCKQTIEPGGDHSFVGFEHFLPQITEFLFPE